MTSRTTTTTGTKTMTRISHHWDLIEICGFREVIKDIEVYRYNDEYDNNNIDNHDDINNRDDNNKKDDNNHKDGKNDKDISTQALDKDMGFSRGYWGQQIW